ncbi:hypothetical protein M0D21_13630 [Aquimarina sp. D1M17]|uniref:hypothetical protein n=1 Tax=Aquimarina acroporae TaxID=2937283 RepID=UPI0020BDECF2|nr:hypothetical protein [Aquimarina acroporae]MCK8522620.1 hypothetical protein [Aquimarina acroporae]
MKYFIYILIAIASVLLAYNTIHLDFKDLFGKDSKAALVGVFASACTIVLMLILLISRRIQEKKKGK